MVIWYLTDTKFGKHLYFIWTDLTSKLHAQFPFGTLNFEVKARDPSISLSLTLMSTRDPHHAYVSSFLQYPLCVCVLLHCPSRSHHDTRLTPHVVEWTPLKDRRCFCRDVKVATYSLHNMVVTPNTGLERPSTINHSL